jgi:hypothetical protein
LPLTERFAALYTGGDGEKVKANFRKRAEEFRETDRKREPGINIIESIRHETRVEADRAIAELMNALTGTIPEKKLIVKKTGNGGARGNSP